VLWGFLLNMAQITADLLRSKFGFNDPNTINNILNNPSEVQRYTREAGLDPEYNTQQALNKVKSDQAALVASQAAKEQDFLGRYKTGITGASTALKNELGIEGLRANALQAGETAAGVQGQLSAITPTQQTVAKQVGISAPRLTQRIAQKTSELSPALSAASSALSTSNAALESGQSAYSTGMSEALLPYTTEASMLSDSLAREATGYNTVIQSELDTLLEKIKQQGTLDLAEIQKAQALAEKEQEYLNQRSTIDLGNRTALINPMTGAEVGSYKQGLAPVRGTLATGW